MRTKKNIPQNRFKELRLEKHLTLRDIENALGFENSSISEFENCIREYPLEKILKICDYFKVSMDYLFYRSNERLMAHQLPKCKQDELTRTEKDFLSAIRRIDNESTLQNIKGVVEYISNSNGGKKEEHNTVIDTPQYDTRKELKHTLD